MMAPSAGEQARLLLDGLAQDVLDAQLGEVDRAADVFGRAVPSGLLCVFRGYFCAPWRKPC